MLSAARVTGAFADSAFPVLASSVEADLSEFQFSPNAADFVPVSLDLSLAWPALAGPTLTVASDTNSADLDIDVLIVSPVDDKKTDGSEVEQSDPAVPVDAPVDFQVPLPLNMLDDLSDDQVSTSSPPKSLSGVILSCRRSGFSSIRVVARRTRSLRLEFKKR